MTDVPPTDEALMLAYQAGDVASFEQLYGRWRGRLFRYLAHQCGSQAKAEELYQDVWLKVVNAREHYEVTAKVSTWLFRIARHRLIDHWRAAGRDPASFADGGDDDEIGSLAAIAAPEAEQPQRWLERKDLAARLAQALADLPDLQREAFVMAEEGEMTLEEIAAVCGVGRETIKSRLRYAHAKLRAALEDCR